METVPDGHKSAARVSGTPICPALALAGEMPADGEGVGEARTGRSCLYGIFARAAGRRDEIPGSSGVRGGKAVPGDVKLENGLLKGRVEMVPCGNLPASLGMNAWSRSEQGIPSAALSFQPWSYSRTVASSALCTLAAFSLPGALTLL